MGGRNVAGEADGFNRLLNMAGKLGFHSPFLVVDDGKYDKATVEAAYETAINSIGSFMEFAGSVNAFSGTPRVQPRLIAQMLKTP